MNENTDFHQPLLAYTLLKAEEVASILNISRSLAYSLLETGELRSVRFGRTLRVRPQDLEAFILEKMVDNNRPIL